MSEEPRQSVRERYAASERDRKARRAANDAKFRARMAEIRAKSARQKAATDAKLTAQRAQRLASRQERLAARRAAPATQSFVATPDVPASATPSRSSMAAQVAATQTASYRKMARRVRPRRVGTAYVLLLLTGIAGGHKIYLFNQSTAQLYMITLGLFGVGLLRDLFTLPRQVREANRSIANGTWTIDAFSPLDFFDS